VGVPVDSSYVMRVLGHDVEVLVASPELAEALHVQSPRDLNDVPWIMHAGPFGGSQHFVRPDTGETCDVAWSPMVHASNSTMMRLLAMRGLGFLVIPTYAIVEDLAAGRLVRILAPWERRRLVLQAIMPSRPHPRRRTVMLEALVAEARGIAQVVQAALVPP
ncbi:MAG: LysR substrate-binding domain-containing protein, partial [Myxococcota bacterium]